MNKEINQNIWDQVTLDQNIGNSGHELISSSRILMSDSLLSGGEEVR